MRPSPVKARTAACTASGPSSRPRAVSRLWWALNAASTTASRGSSGLSTTRPTTLSVISTGQRAPPQTCTKRRSSPAVIMSSSAEAVTRSASARSAGSSLVTSPCRVSTSVSGQLDPVEQVGVAVVEDPALGPGQPGSEPPTHRPGPAPEVVDDQPTRGQEGHELVGELGRPSRSVGRLAQGQPGDARPGRGGGRCCHRATSIGVNRARARRVVLINERDAGSVQRRAACRGSRPEGPRGESHRADRAAHGPREQRAGADSGDRRVGVRRRALRRCAAGPSGGGRPRPGARRRGHADPLGAHLRTGRARGGRIAPRTLQPP